MSRIEDITIERCPHDVENPYAQINRDLIRNESISPECRWLLIYLLSMSSRWKISVKQIYSHVMPFMGIRKVYSLFKEAMKAGYIRKEDVKNGNLRAGVKYFLSEVPKINRSTENSNNFSDVAVFDASDFGMPKTVTHKKDNDSSIEESFKKEKIKEICPSPELGTTPLPSFDQEAMNVANELWDKIRSVQPTHKPPNLLKWSETLLKAHRIDNRTWDDIRLVLKFIFDSSDFWSRTIQSAEGLRRNFDKIYAQMRPPTTSDAIIAKNLEVAQAAKRVLLKKGTPESLIIHKSCIAFPDGDSVSLSLNPQTFKEILINRFNLKEKGGV